MAETPVEVVIRARNEAQAALNQAVGQLRQLEQQTKLAGSASRHLGPLRDAIGGISPAASGAIAQIEGLARAGAGLGTVGLAAAGIAGGIGLITAASVAAAKSLGDMVEQLDNLAAATGTDAGDVQVLQEAFERAGLGAETARTALHRLNIAIAEGSPVLKAMGVDAKEPIQALLQLSEAFATSNDAGARARVAQELFSKSSKDLLAVIDQLRTKFPELTAEMERTKQKLDPEMLEAGRRADEMFERLGGAAAGFGNRVKLAAATALEGLMRFGPGFLVAFTSAGKATAAMETHAKILAAMAKQWTFATDAVSRGAAALDKSKKSVDEHAAKVKELVELFGLERQEAERLVKAQEDLARARRKAALQKELFEPKQIEGVGVSAKPLPLAQPGDQGFQGPLQFQPPDLSELDKVLEFWNAFVDEMTSGAAMLDGAINAMLAGLTAGFNAVFQNLLTQGQTFSSAMVTIFKAMVSALLAELARLLAFKVLEKIVDALTGGLPARALADAANFTAPTPSLRGAQFTSAQSTGDLEASLDGMARALNEQNTAALTTSMDRLGRTLAAPEPEPVRLQAFGPGLGLETPTPMASRLEASLAQLVKTVAAVLPTPSSGNAGDASGPTGMDKPEPAPQQITYNINALDAHSLVMSLQLPQGGLRRAGDRINVAGAY